MHGCLFNRSAQQKHERANTWISFSCVCVRALFCVYPKLIFPAKLSITFAVEPDHLSNSARTKSV